MTYSDIHGRMARSMQRDASLPELNKFGLRRLLSSKCPRVSPLKRNFASLRQI